MRHCEYREGIGLDPCPCCKGDQWVVWVSLACAYFTAYAACDGCGALYFTQGEDVSEERALASLKEIVGSGIHPYC